MHAYPPTSKTNTPPPPPPPPRQVLTGEIERLTKTVAEKEEALKNWEREAELASQLAEVGGVVGGHQVK